MNKRLRRWPRGRLCRRAALLPALALLAVQLLSSQILSLRSADLSRPGDPDGYVYVGRLRRSVVGTRPTGRDVGPASPTEVVTSSPDGRTACRCDLLSLDCLDSVACVGGGRDARSAAATARALLTRTTIRRMTKFDDSERIYPYNLDPIGKVREALFPGCKFYDRPMTPI